jgi:hypothetical protein
MGRACTTNGEKRNAYMILVGNPGGKRVLCSYADHRMGKLIYTRVILQTPIFLPLLGRTRRVPPMLISLCYIIPYHWK